jgi:hypothetical protein
MIHRNPLTNSRPIGDYFPMIRLATCTEEEVSRAKSFTDAEIEELIAQIFRHERPQGDYWGIMYVRDLWALGIEPRIAPNKIVASFGQAYSGITDDWESRKSGNHRPYFGTEAEIEEYKAAHQNKNNEAQSDEKLTQLPTLNASGRNGPNGPYN